MSGVEQCGRCSVKDAKPLLCLDCLKEVERWHYNKGFAAGYKSRWIEPGEQVKKEVPAG